MSAKYYTYFNLHKRCWSIMYRGKVIKHFKNCRIAEATTKVREAGRLRVLKEKRKNVHAFLVSEKCPEEITHDSVPYYLEHMGLKVRYNPYKMKTFMVEDKEAKRLVDVYCFGGKTPPEVVAAANL